MSRLLLALLVMLNSLPALIGVQSAWAGADNFAAAPRAVGELPSARTPVMSTSDRWSGYAVVPGRPYTSMQGSWNVPEVSFAAGRMPGTKQYSSAWIGIGGDADGDNTLVQLGTNQIVAANGTTEYYAWYLFYDGLGHGATPLDSGRYPVQPGDSLTATITCVASCQPNKIQSWRLTMNNPNWAAPWVSPVIQYSDSLASAEWIMEAATVGGVIADMPNFSAVTFSQALVNGATPDFGNAEAIALLSDNTTPVAEPLTPNAPGSFTVARIGLLSKGTLPSVFRPVTCPAGPQVELVPTPITIQGNLTRPETQYRQVYVTKYAELQTSLVQPQLRPFAVDVVDDLTSMAKEPTMYQENGDLRFLRADPGFYCLRLQIVTAVPSTPYQFGIAAPPAGLPNGTTPEMAQTVPRMDLGNTNNLYWGSRYVWEQSHPNDHNAPSPVLVALRPYELRDWVGVASPSQWYRFSLDAPRDVSVGMSNLYFGATATILDSNRKFVGATVYETGDSFGGPTLPDQHYHHLLPAGSYYLLISFSGIGSPGTPFNLGITAQ